MPPRKQKAEDTVTTIETPEATAPVAETVETKRTRDLTPVKLTTAFAVVDKADVPVRARMRSRSNPFDEVIGQAWEQYDPETEGDALVQVGVDHVKRAIRQIVSAATFHECGVTIIVDTDQGTSDRSYEGPGDLWFYPRPKRERADGSDDDGSDES